MNKKLMFSTILICFLAFCLVFASCGGSGGLVGLWESEDGDTIEFFKDGTVTDWDGDRGTWKSEGNHLALLYQGDEWWSGDYKLSGKRLTLTEEDGTITVFTKK